ncbi:hypothetical protein D3C87_2122440 [compost metagenome]
MTVTAAPREPPGFDAVVVIEFTYLVPEPADTSQPQPPAATAVPDDADWIVSVMLVRHEEAAKIASDIFARAV